jgi:glutamate/tyrosine decarboxylase-like PLP-dependent enzyme
MITFIQEWMGKCSSREKVEMKIPEKGMKKEDLFKTLKSYKGDDVDWKSGRVLGYIYYPGDKAHDVIDKAYTMFLTENALDPTVFPSALRLENEVVGMVANLLRGDENVVGNFTSGGTESIILAVKTARDYARATRPHIKEPEMVLPVTAHASFYKAAHYLDIKPVITPVHDGSFLADVDAMRAAITDNTILLVGSAPGYTHGVVDPIADIADLALEKDLLCHVDGRYPPISTNTDMRLKALPLCSIKIKSCASIKSLPARVGQAIRSSTLR